MSNKKSRCSLCSKGGLRKTCVIGDLVTCRFCCTNSKCKIHKKNKCIKECKCLDNFASGLGGCISTLNINLTCCYTKKKITKDNFFTLPCGHIYSFNPITLPTLYRKCGSAGCKDGNRLITNSCIKIHTGGDKCLKKWIIQFNNPSSIKITLNSSGLVFSPNYKDSSDTQMHEKEKKRKIIDLDDGSNYKNVSDNQMHEKEKEKKIIELDDESDFKKKKKKKKKKKNKIIEKRTFPWGDDYDPEEMKIKTSYLVYEEYLKVKEMLTDMSFSQYVNRKFKIQSKKRKLK